MSQKRETILPRLSRRYQGTRTPLGNQGVVEKWTTDSNSSRKDLDGNQNRQCSNLGPLESTPTDTRPKMKEKRQKWSREELKQIFYFFYYALENLWETCITERTYKLWRERNQTERLHIDAIKLTNIRQDVMKKKRLTDAELQETKN